jgi:hypothetical protein
MAGAPVGTGVGVDTGVAVGTGVGVACTPDDVSKAIAANPEAAADSVDVSEIGAADESF